MGYNYLYNTRHLFKYLVFKCTFEYKYICMENYEIIKRAFGYTIIGYNSTHLDPYQKFNFETQFVCSSITHVFSS